MTNPYDGAIAAIHSIRQQLDAVLHALTTGTALPPTSVAPYTGTGGPGPQVADDADLDGQWGNPTVRKDPRDWQGQTYVGANYSDCPPDYLMKLAGLLDWMAKKSDEKNELTANGKPRSRFMAADAARARGWAQRNAAKAAGHRPPKPAAPGSMSDPDDDLPPF